MSITTAQSLPEADSAFGSFSASAPLAETETGDEAGDTLVVEATHGLSDVGRMLWSDTLQTSLDHGDLLRDVAIAGVKALDVIASDMTTILDGTYQPENLGGPSSERTILSMPVDGPLSLRTLYRAAWAGYVLSLEATIAAGTNDRCWLDDGNADTARGIVEELGATATPHSCVYGSGGTFMEGCDLEFDAETGKLRAAVLIGS
jgi:hypothetical protein